MIRVKGVKKTGDIIFCEKCGGAEFKNTNIALVYGDKSIFAYRCINCDAVIIRTEIKDSPEEE